MKVKFYGTRGSVPIANPNSVKYGGNTTCLRIYSDCIPRDLILTIDAGTGFVPMSLDALKEGLPKEVLVLFSHYHHDHTQGLFLSPLLFMKNIKLKLCGPVDVNIGPKEMVETMMRPPYFPVHHEEVGSHIGYENFEFPKTMVILIHPEGGYRIISIENYEQLLANQEFLPIGKGKYPVDQCLVITMYKSRHPEQTISYRLEERPTGKVFVFLTDHENEDGIPLAMKSHIKNADLLVMDSQYSREKYEKSTAGFGHGTPDYCVKIAKAALANSQGSIQLGLIHHDPSSTDKGIEAVLKEATEKSNDSITIFACADYQEILLDNIYIG